MDLASVNSFLKVLPSEHPLEKCKHIRFETSKDLRETISFLSDENFISKFNADPFMFLVFMTLDVEEKNFTLNLDELIETKPLVLVFQFVDKISIFSKDIGKTNINALNTKRHFDEIFAVDDEDKSSFEYFFNALLNIFTEAKLEIKDNFRDDFIASTRIKDLVEEAIKSNNILGLRFYSAICYHDIDIKSLEFAVEVGTFQSIAAILRLPFFDYQSKCREYKLKNFLSNFNNDDGYSLLMIALKRENPDIQSVDFFIRYCDINYRNNYESLAIDMAFESSNLEIVVKLLRVGSPFPSEFTGNISLHPELKEYVENVENFFLNIERGCLKEIKRIVKSEPKYQFHFNQKNDSALFCAMKSGHYKIFAFLESHGFNPSSKEDILILDENVRFLKRYENYYLHYLLSCSKFSSEDQNEKYEKLIQLAFKRLNKVPFLPEIMKVLVEWRSVEIVFLFKKLFPLDPNNQRHVSGSTDILDGKIVIRIDAEQLLKETTFNIALSNLAHEIAHACFYIVYENDMFPYHEYKLEDKEDFQNNVVEYFRENRAHEMLNDIFEYEEEKIPKEMIVLVPEVLAREGVSSKEDEAYMKLRKLLKPLFDFFEKTQDYALKSLNTIAVRRETKKLNISFNILENLKRPHISVSNECLKKLDTISDRKIVVFLTNRPELNMNAIYEIFRNQFRNSIETRCIFGNYLTVDCDGYYDAAIKCSVPDELPILILDFTHQFISMSQILKLIETSSKVFLIMKKKESLADLIYEFGENEIDTRAINYSWNDFNESTRSLLFEKVLSFQGKVLTFKRLLGSSNPCLMEHIDLDNLLGIPTLEIERRFSEVTNSSEYSMPRFFSTCQNFEPQENSKKLRDLINDFKTYQSILIHGVAGVGKTTILLEIARRLKNKDSSSWIEYIELRKFSAPEVLALHNSNETKTLRDTICYDMLRIQDKFTAELFKWLFEKKKVMFLFDGFDEIQTETCKFFMELFEKLFKIKIKFITVSRSIHAKRLNNSIFSRVYLVKSFSPNEQTEFVLRNLNYNEKEKEESMHTVIHENMSKLLSNDMLHLMKVPQNLKMFVKIYGGNILDKNLKTEGKITNLWDFCETFIAMINSRWKEKGEVVKIAHQDMNHIGTSTLEFHQLLAIHHFFPHDFVAYEEILEIQNTCEHELSLFGLTRKNFNGNLELSHETLIEYFLVDFVASKLLKNSRFIKSEVEVCFKIIVKIANEINFDTARTLLNQAIMKFCTPKVYMRVNFEKYQIIFSCYCHELKAHYLCVEKCYETLNYISELHVGDSLVFNNTDVFENNILMYMVDKNCNADEVKKIWDIIKLKTRPENLQFFLRHTNYLGQALLTVSVQGSAEVFCFVWNLAKSLFQDPENFLRLLRKKDCSMQEAFHLAVKHGALEVVSRVWRTLKFKLLPFERDSFFKNDSKLNIIRLAAKYNQSSDVFDYIWKMGLEKYDATFLRELIKNVNNGHSMIHECASSNNEKVLETLFSKLTDFGKKKILESVDGQGLNLLQSAKSRNKNSLVEDFLRRLMLKFNVDPKALNFQPNIMYFWNELTLSYEWKLKCTENIIEMCRRNDDILEVWRNLKETEELSHLQSALELRNSLNNDCTILHSVYAHEQLKTVKNFHRFLIPEFEISWVKGLFKANDNLGVLPIGYAVAYNEPEVLEAALEFSRHVFGEEEFSTFLMEEIIERKLLHNSVSKNNKSIKVIFSFIMNLPIWKSPELKDTVELILKQHSGCIAMTDNDDQESFNVQ